jgi:hypothetical protein
VRAALLLAGATACSGTFGYGSAREAPMVALTAIADASIICDIGQTYYASDSGRWDRAGRDGRATQEEDPLLGHEPATAHLKAIGFLAVAFTSFFGTMPELPRWARGIFLGWTIAAESYLVVTHWGGQYGYGACGVTGTKNYGLMPSQ